MDMGTVGLLLAGFVTLVAGGELLVRGASGIAAAVGMSPLVVGLTVVAFATSAPELAVTLQAVRDGSPDLAVGNVVGSNIANVLLVLGSPRSSGPWSSGPSWSGWTSRSWSPWACCCCS